MSQEHLALLVESCHRAASETRAALASLKDWGPLGEKGSHKDQYEADLVADKAALKVLNEAGLRVLSEESGWTHASAKKERSLTKSADGWELIAVLDPLDGSTNAARGIPFYGISICILGKPPDQGQSPWVPLVGFVEDLVSGTRWQALANGPATCNGTQINASSCQELSQALISLTGDPGPARGWRQMRSLGSAALELCLVAQGSLDAFSCAGGFSLAPWDYLAGLLVCEQAGCSWATLDSSDPFSLEQRARSQLCVAASNQLLEGLTGALGA
jgi:fructose-1,6-bisphosphatase/inositol monophosphatase family enzyme